MAKVVEFMPDAPPRKGVRQLNYIDAGDIDPNIRKDWLISNFLGAAEVSCVFGQPGSGKSVLVGDLASHIATGQDWCGRRVQAGCVLYVAAERASVTRRRVVAWRMHHGIDRFPLRIVADSLDLKGQNDADAVIRASLDLGDSYKQEVRLIVIDTVNRALAGGDENSPKDMGAFIGNVDRIQRQTGSHVMLVHHVPHGENRLRGHSSLTGAVDTTIGVEHASGLRIARIFKTNDGEEGEQIAVTLQSVEISFDEATSQTTTAPVAIPIEGDIPSTGAQRRRSDKQEIATRCLTSAIERDPRLLPADFNLPQSVTGTAVDSWRSELVAQGALNEANARQDFKRLKDALTRRGDILERNGLVWKVR